MLPLRSALFATAAFFCALATLHAAPDAAKLREQLALATTDDDTLARIELLRRILDAEPDDVASRQLLIELWLSIRDYDLAESTLEAWPDAPPLLAVLTRAKVLRYRDEDLSGAVRILNDYLAKSPDDISALEALVNCLLATDDHVALLKALDTLIQQKRDATNLIRRANVKLQLTDYLGALGDAKAAQSLEPDADIVKNNLPPFERLEETLKVLPSLDAAIAQNPKDITKLLDRAWWLRYGSMADRSLADAEAALAVVPDSLMAKIVKVRALYLLGKLKSNDARLQQSIDVTQAHSIETAQAILACDLALAKNPKDTTKFRERAHALNEAQQYLLAQKDAEAAIAIDPQAADAALEGLYATEMLGQDPVPLFRRIEQMKPTKAQLAIAAGYLADLYFRQSNYPLTLEFANRSLALNETERLLRVKGATLQRLNRTDEANEVIRRADALHKK